MRATAGSYTSRRAARYYNDWAARLEAQAQYRAGQRRAATAALAMRALAVILERCRLDRLTRNQHILFRLGELIAYAETAAIFAERVGDKPTEAIPLDSPRARRMARIHAREAALKVATDGLRWAIGAGQTDPNLAASLNLPAIYASAGRPDRRYGLRRRQLNAAFPASDQWTASDSVPRDPS